MRQRGACLAVLALSALGRPGSAGEVGIGVEAGYFDLSNARRSAEAIFDGSTGGLSLGAQVRFDLGRRFFAGGGARVFRRTGERVFVADASSPVFGLGHPLKVRLVPAFGLFGYRFRPGARLTPHVALGVGATWFREESEVGGITTSDSRTKASGLLMAGADYGRGSFRVGAELSYSLVPNTVGLDGVSEVYGEDDLGGFAAVGKIIFVP